MGTGSPADRADLNPPGNARRGEGEDRHQAVTQAHHAAPPPRAPQISEKLEALREQIASFRARAIDLHVKLVDLESKGDADVRALRAAMMASVVRIESVVRALSEVRDPGVQPPPAFPDGTRER